MVFIFLVGDNGTLEGFDFLKNTTHGDRTANRIATGYTGSNQSHYNISPYLAIYLWKRLA